MSLKHWQTSIIQAGFSQKPRAGFNLLPRQWPNFTVEVIFETLYQTCAPRRLDYIISVARY